MSTALAIKCDELGDESEPDRNTNRLMLPMRRRQSPLHPPKDLPRLQGHRPGPCAARGDRKGNPGIEAGTGKNRLGIGSRIPGILTSAPRQGG